VSLQQITDSFIPCMNPPDPSASSFDPTHIAAEDTRAHAIPLPSPPAIHPAFNDPLTLDDISSIQSYLKRTTHSNSTGVDAATYDLLINIDNDLLLPLFQCAIEQYSTQTCNYRAIALESCVLKFASLLVHHKLCLALEQSNTIPPSQNGFLEGYHTNNNTFILRTIIDKARARGETIYLVFVDISNAFPSTNQSSLWNKLS
ncbi:hypothetical protein C8J55DRAFT_382644, partial [Lentinula edodes]